MDKIETAYWQGYVDALLRAAAECRLVAELGVMTIDRGTAMTCARRIGAIPLPAKTDE